VVHSAPLGRQIGLRADSPYHNFLVHMMHATVLSRFFDRRKLACPSKQQVVTIDHFVQSGGFYLCIKFTSGGIPDLVMDNHTVEAPLSGGLSVSLIAGGGT